MARITVPEIFTRIKNPKHRNELNFACLQEEWLKMHCEPILQKSKLPPRAYLDFTMWVKSFVTADKTARVMSLLTTPFETVATTKSIFDQLGKFFEAQDRYIKLELIDAELEFDYNQYLEKIKDADFWTTKGMDALRIGINSIVVCDLPETQTTPKPEPYYYLLDILNVIDIDLNQKTDAVEYVIFKADDHTIIALDDEYFRVFKAVYERDGDLDFEFPYIGMSMESSYRPATDNLDTSKFVLHSEVRHSTFTTAGAFADGLGYCPAIDFYGCVISGTKRIDKRGPVTDVITKLNFLLFFLTLAKYYYLYGPFPIICSFKIKDKYVDEKNAESVDTGTQTISTNQWSAYDLVAVDVIDPRKQPRNLIGPGSSIEVPGMGDKDDPDYMANGPLKIIEMSVDNLEWVKGYVQYLSDDIKKICTGRTPQVNNAAKNEDQVGESLEEQKSILDKIGEQFERAHKFVLETVGILRYTRKYFVSATVDYGSDYFLKTADEQTEEFDQAKKSGMNAGYLYALKKNVITTKFKNNKDQLNQQILLLELEPYPEYTVTELKTLGIDQQDWVNFVIKLNFTTFVQRFQAEYGNIVTFMSQSDYKLKIAFIYSKLQEYGRRIAKPVAEPVGGNGGTP